MKFDVGEVLRNPGSAMSVSCEADMSDVDLYGETVFSSPVFLSGEVRNRAGLVTFEGSVRAVGQVSCARCLEPAEVERDIPLSFTLTEELQSADVEDYLYVGGDHLLDLHDVVRDELILSLDMVTLCKPDCKGLCPVCGKNRNTDLCTCQKVIGKPNPFSALSSLFDQNNEEV